MKESRLLPLLHLCDSLFPTGAFAHSDGLESATADGRVASAADLGDWMDVCLDETLARCESPAVKLAWQAFTDREWTTLDAIDAEVHALRPAAAARDASRAIGGRLVKTWHQLHPHPDLRHLIEHGPPALTLPVAFGIACASAEITARAAIEGFIYTRLAATVSAAMRLMPVGQHEAHGVLASRLTRVPAVVDAVIVERARPASFAPALDIALMTHQYVHSRLFRS
jgi:urease accessory protein